MEDKFLKVAKEAALEAGKVIQKYLGKKTDKKVKHEDVSDFATDADLEAEKVIISILSQNFPTHNIITEEQENIQKGSEYSWVIDPLDGTFSFSHGIPQFSVMIGLLMDNKPILGVINHVPSGDLYWAEQVHGAFVNGYPLHVSATKKLSSAAIHVDFGHIKRRQIKYDLYIGPLMNKVGRLCIIDPALAYVATGLVDGFVAQAWVWDFAAGTVIVREAGGKVTDFEGNEPDWTKERLNIVASNGLIHDQILEALK